MANGLILVGDIYYFQKSLPLKLANHLGVKIFKKSLGLDSRSEALKITAELNIVFTSIFKEFKRSVNVYDGYTQEEMKKLLLTEFYKIIDKYHTRALPVLPDRDTENKSVYTIKTLVEQYLSYIDEIKHLNINTITAHRAALHRIFHKFDSISITDLNLAHVRQTLTELSAGATVGTTKEYIAKLKTFLKWVTRHKDIAINSRIVNLIDDFNSGLKAEKVRDALDLNQLKRFFGPQYTEWFKHPYTYFPVLLLYVCGLRVSEALKLTVDDLVDYNGRTLIQIKDGKTENAKRYVVIPEIVNNLGFKFYVDNYLKTNPPPGACLWGRRIGSKYLATKVTKYLLTLGIKEGGKDRRYTEHSLRHSFATKLIASSVDDRFAKRYMGHSGSSLMTSRYFIQNVEAEDLLNQVDAKLSFDGELRYLRPFNLEGIKEYKISALRNISKNFKPIEIDPETMEYQAYIRVKKDFETWSRTELLYSDFESFDQLSMQAFLEVARAKFKKKST